MSDIEHRPADTLDLRDYLRVLRRRRGVAVATLVLVVAVAMVVTFAQTPIYASQVRLIPERFDEVAGADAALQQLVFGQSELETQREVVTSEPVADIVAAELGLNDSPDELLERVDVRLVGESQVLEIRAESEDPQLAAALAQGFADAYLEYRRTQELDRTLAAVNRLQQRARQIRQSLEEIADEQEDASGPELDALEQEESALLAQLGSIQAQIANLPAGGGFSTGGGEVISSAEIPQTPASPRPLRTGALAVVLGAMLGVGMAFLRDMMDDSIRSDDEIRRAIGRPVLGHIPRWKNAEIEGPEGLAAYVAPRSVTGEAYQTLHTNVRFMGVARDLKSVLVTSASSGDGKTTTAANVAIAAARTGRQVLLVGVDFRRPKLHRLFNIDATPGLTELLAGDVSGIAEILYPVDMPNLRIVPSGSVPPNPAELLNSAVMTQTMAAFNDMADIVIYDGPPVLAVADALELAPKTGGTLLVVSAGHSGRHAVRATAERLASIEADVLGAVLNNIPRTKDSPYQYYAEYYGYGEDATVDDSDVAGLSRRQRRKLRKNGRSADAEAGLSRRQRRKLRKNGRSADAEAGLSRRQRRKDRKAKTLPAANAPNEDSRV